MKLDNGLAAFPRLAGVGVNAALAAALGASLGGLRGAQIGLLAGLLLSFVPLAAAASRAYLARPDGLARFVAREMQGAAIGAASSLATTLARWLSPFHRAAQTVARVLRLPLLVVSLVASVAAAELTAMLSRLFRAFATPLGLANLGVLLVIAADLAGFDFASLAVFAALPAIIMVLFVDEFETRAEAPE